MFITEKIEKILQFIKQCLLLFQSDQINKFFESIKLFNVCMQFFISFTSIILLIFFSKIPDKIKTKVEVIPVTDIENDSYFGNLINHFQTYLHYIPSAQKNIVAEPYYFRI